MTIPSTPAKGKTLPVQIGTRYVAVQDAVAPHGAYIATTAASHPFTVPAGYRLYALLDPHLAEQWEELRKAHDRAADNLTDAISGGVQVHDSHVLFMVWNNARCALAAFEKQHGIGGGA